MNYMMLDTCVLLDLLKDKNGLLVISALEMLIENKSLVLVLPELVITEFAANRERVVKSIKQRITQELKTVRKIVDEFGGDKKDQVIDVLNDVSSRLPILSDVSNWTIGRVENLMKDSTKLQISDNAKFKAVQRAIEKKAPFKKNKNSMADALIIESFSEFVSNTPSQKNNFFIFVTVNNEDFSSTDHRKPHEDFHEIFELENTLFFNNVPDALKKIDQDILSDIEFENNFIDETRGLREILSAMDELVDKIWYNRHCYRLHAIETGRISIIPKGTKKYGNDVIHEDIWEGALKAAQLVEEKYDDVGPWDDFEWGMLNGKLSALRWVLGDEWNMLDA